MRRLLGGGMSNKDEAHGLRTCILATARAAAQARRELDGSADERGLIFDAERSVEQLNVDGGGDLIGIKNVGERELQLPWARIDDKNVVRLE